MFAKAFPHRDFGAKGDSEDHWDTEDAGMSWTNALLDLCLTHLAPDRPSPPTLLPYHETHRPPGSSQLTTIHTSISADANRNGTLARLVASFSLLFTTSSNILCSKFSWVWETLWIFKVVRWTCNRCTKINKSPTVSNGVGASSFVIWTANLAQLLTMGTLTNSQSFIFGDSNWKFCKVGYPAGTQKFRCRLFWLGIFFFMLLFLSEKIKTCWIYKNTIFANWEKYKVSWNFWFVFIIDF